MIKEKLQTEIEVFVCNHRRDEGDSCYALGANELTDYLKKWAKEEHRKEIKIYRSGCLSRCSEGIAVACFPKKELFLKVKADEAKEIKKGLLEALLKLKE